MKLLYIILPIICPFLTTIIFGNNAGAQQCSSTQTAHSITYDTSLTGNGNDIFNLSFPKFPIDLGTLVLVKIETMSTLIYSYQLENTGPTSASHRVRLSLTDELEYPGNLIQQTSLRNFGPYILAGSDGMQGSGPDYKEEGPLEAFKNQLHTYNITDDVTPFEGIGNIDINYNTYAFANVIGNLNSSLMGQAQDVVNFKITYFYCNMSVLAADIMQFAATKLSTGDVQLSWLTPNDYAGRKYEIQKSPDGRTFTTLQSLISGNLPSLNKQVVYHPAKEDNNKIFFRVRQLEPDGSYKYSAIRQVTLDSDGSTIRVYPTLATNAINIYLPPANKDAFKVSIISTTGQVVQQSEFSKTNLFSMPFTRKLAPGMYLVALYNKKTMETLQSKIIVQ